MKRLYEWRDDAGRLCGKPEFAENACVFRESAVRSGTITKTAGPGNRFVHVTSTGERIEFVCGRHGSRLAGWDEAQVFDARVIA